MNWHKEYKFNKLSITCDYKSCNVRCEFDAKWKDWIVFVSYTGLYGQDSKEWEIGHFVVPSFRAARTVSKALIDAFRRQSEK